ncbi:MAG: sterol desaturase family protein [Acidobacteriota bacterium]|nr:sterol desaturase family protein [Acidobacteriota bacterium]
MSYGDLFVRELSGYARYFFSEVAGPHWGNYFYWLIAISLTVYLLEILFPWRKNQSRVRRDFWLDSFYMFFNFFLFSLIGYHALSMVVAQGFNDFLDLFGITNLVALEVQALPRWVQLLILFLARDFIHFNVHRLLHRVPILWEFHKVHHSVLEMGYAAHLRFHWMETVVYRTLEYLPLAMIGFGIQDFILVHLAALTIGHLNHANFVLPLGPLKYLFNNPRMHIWHHVKHNPEHLRYGVNFGISISLWDYLFRTAYIPKDGRDIELGFDEVENFPQTFSSQAIWPLSRAR